MNEKKLKICYFVGSFPTKSETFIVNQINDMIERGHDVQIYSVYKKNIPFIHKSITKYNLLEKVTYAPQIKGTEARYFMSNLFSIVKFFLKNINNIDLKILKNLIKNRDSFLLRKLIRYPMFLIREDFDIIHAHFGDYVTIVSHIFNDKTIKKNKKIVGTFHGTDLKYGDLDKNKILYKNIHKNIDYFTVNNEYLRDLLLKANPNIKNILELPVGLDVNYLQTLLKDKKSRNTKLNLLFVGRFVGFKAPDLTVKIMNEVVNNRGLNDIYLKMVGDGELEEEVKSLIDLYRLNNHIELLGSQTQEKIASLFNESHAFLFPGITEAETFRAETQGMVIQEAQFFKSPPITSNAGGISFGVLKDKTAFVLEEKNIEVFANIIEDIFHNKIDLIKMGEVGHHYVKEKFNIKEIGNRLENLYLSL